MFDKFRNRCFICGGTVYSCDDNALTLTGGKYAVLAFYCDDGFPDYDGNQYLLYWDIDSLIPSGDEVPASIPVEEVFFDPDAVEQL